MALVCTYAASVRVSGAAKPLREVTFKTPDAADRWLAQQRSFAKERGWGGLTFERRENCRSTKKRR